MQEKFTARTLEEKMNKLLEVANRTNLRLARQPELIDIIFRFTSCFFNTVYVQSTTAEKTPQNDTHFFMFSAICFNLQLCPMKNGVV